MKRACYEWGWLLLAPAAAACLGLWAVSMTTNRANFRFDVDGRSVIRIEQGEFNCSNLGAGLESNYFYNLYQPPLPELVIHAPGLKFRSVDTGLPDCHPFTITFSLLIPGCAAAIVGVLCFWRFQVIRQAATIQPPLSES